MDDLTYISGDDENDDPQRPFDWDRDVGNYSPRQSVSDCRRDHWTFREYAEDYAAHWPFDTQPPTNLVEGMVREMERAEAELSD